LNETKGTKGAKCYGYVGDITNHEKVRALALEIERDVGIVTILINNAGISTGTKIFDSK
jgi:gluconate 5-dehydrogenase